MQTQDMEGRDDLLHLNDFSEENVTYTVKKRFQEGQIFTQIGGPILISLNPYRKLPVFNLEFA